MQHWRLAAVRHLPQSAQPETPPRDRSNGLPDFCLAFAAGRIRQLLLSACLAARVMALVRAALKLKHEGVALVLQVLVDADLRRVVPIDGSALQGCKKSLFQRHRMIFIPTDSFENC